MSSFFKKGKRESVNKLNKKRIKEIMFMLEELDRVAVELIKYSVSNDKKIDKEDIEKLAQGFTDMTIGALEVSLLWSKINDFEQRANERIKNKDNEQEEDNTN